MLQGENGPASNEILISPFLVTLKPSLEHLLDMCNAAGVETCRLMELSQSLVSPIFSCSLSLYSHSPFFPGGNIYIYIYICMQTGKFSGRGLEVEGTNRAREHKVRGREGASLPLAAFYIPRNLEPGMCTRGDASLGSE